MRLVSKIVDPLNHFWVEDYNEKAKKFFLDLGFKEVKYGGFKPKFNLEYHGSGLFNGWSKNEKKRIFNAISELSEDEHSQFEWDGSVYEMNPYE